MKPKNNIFVEILEHGGVIHTYCVHQEILDGVTWEHIKLFLPLPSSQLCISIHCSAHILCNVLLFEMQAMHYKEKMRKTIRDTREGAQSELPSITSCQRLRCSIATNNSPRLHNTKGGIINHLCTQTQCTIHIPMGCTKMYCAGTYKIVLECTETQRNVLGRTRVFVSTTPAENLMEVLTSHLPCSHPPPVPRDVRDVDDDDDHHHDDANERVVHGACCPR